ncbi:Uncharacterised protein [Vibrio cholerae]|nr:Uncharacterised protein [Vibrio cholerae]
MAIVCGVYRWCQSAAQGQCLPSQLLDSKQRS